jgi:predicted transposase YdaD
LIHLIGVDEAYVPEQLKAIKNAIIASPSESQSVWLELLETILVYKLPRLSRDEVKEMLSDILNVQLKQTRFYQDVFAEGQQEGEVMMLLRLLEKRFGASA